VLVNHSKRPLLLLAGELVSGGKQDRVIAKDRIVAVIQRAAASQRILRRARALVVRIASSIRRRRLCTQAYANKPQ